MLSQATSGREPMVKVKVHNSPPMSTPRNPPSPNMIPRFTHGLEPSAELESTKTKTRTKNIKSPSSAKTTSTSNKGGSRISVSSQRVNFKTVQKLDPNKSKPHAKLNVKRAPLQRNLGLTSSLININMTRLTPSKQTRRPRTAGDKPDLISESFRDLLMNKYPPYNPEEFAPRENQDKDNLDPISVPDKDLLSKIREELNEWTKKEKCPEEWTSVVPVPECPIAPKVQTHKKR